MRRAALGPAAAMTAAITIVVFACFFAIGTIDAFAETAQTRLDSFQADLRGFRQRGAQLRGQVDRFRVPPGPFCLPRDENLIASTRQALDELQTAAREHATRFNDFKSDWQRTLQGNSIIKTHFYQAELMVDEDKFWQNDIARNNTMLQNLAAKRSAFDALVAGAQPCPQPQTATAPPPRPPPPPVNPLAGLPRPTLGPIVLPELPDYFCSFEDRQKWIDTVFNPLWNRSWNDVTALRDYGAAIYRRRYESGPVDARTQAALEREDRWQKETHQKYDDWRTRLLELRGHLPPVLDCTRRRPQDVLAGGPANGLSGPYAGIGVTVNVGDQRIDERLAATDALTNKLNSSGGSFGGGLVAGYNFVMTGNIAAGPYVSWDIYDQKINHDFPGGSFIGSTTHWIAEVGLKAAYAVSGSTAVYGLAGASFLNEDLRINFGGPVTNESRTRVGITVGGGVEFRPVLLQTSNWPVAVFTQFQHTRYEDAHLQMPVSSPAFNYDYRRVNNTLKAGLIVYRN